VRIKIVQKPPTSGIDRIRLDHFEVGSRYEVGSMLGALLLAERWAQPVTDDGPPLLVPLNQAEAFSECVTELAPSNLVRESVPPYFDHLASAADFERRKASPTTRASSRASLRLSRLCSFAATGLPLALPLVVLRVQFICCAPLPSLRIHSHANCFRTRIVPLLSDFLWSRTLWIANCTRRHACPNSSPTPTVRDHPLCRGGSRLVVVLEEMMSTVSMYNHSVLRTPCPAIEQRAALGR
jgi:hypothetical protein